MNSTSNKKAAQERELPTFNQAVNMALMMVGDVMDTLATVRRADTNWDDNDSDADFSIDLARKELDSLIRSKCISEKEFFESWWRISSVVSLADKSFKRECTFKDYLRVLPESFRVLGEMIELSGAKN